MRMPVRALVVTVLGLAVSPAVVRAQDHANHATDHAVHQAPAGEAATLLTLNVSISNGGFEPAAVFVPAGQPVQLMLRGRGTAEHHYRVAGLEPEELWWILPPSGEGGEHDHHNVQYTTSRAPSPSGITPTGREVHGYVSAARNIDVVLFAASTPGTYDIVCDLHPDTLGRLTVFDAAAPAATTGAGAMSGVMRAALTKDLGVVDYPGAKGIQVEAMYAPDDEPHVALVVTERTHTTNLPPAQEPELFVSGTRFALFESKVITDSVHHRATSYRYVREAGFGSGHQMMTLRLASGQEATWHLPLMIATPGAGVTGAGVGERWALILAMLGGMLTAMWPCLFQLTVYFIPALAGVAMQEGGSSSAAGRRQILVAAFYFILGFTLVYTATGAVIGYAAQQFGDTSQFESWQRYVGVAAGVVVIGLALRVAAKVRAPLVCRMPILSRMANSNKPATRLEMMLAGLAFATGCMTCFGSALVIGMVVYVGLAQSALYGALVLFLFSLGMGIPLVIAAVAMARALPTLMKLERAVPWMGLASAVLMAAFGTLLISGNYMLVSEWTYRLVRATPF